MVAHCQVLQLLVVVVVVGGCVVEGVLPPLEQPYNILVLMPVSVRSHRHVIQPIAEALAHRGHKVVTLTKASNSAASHPNLTQLVTEISLHEEDTNFFHMRRRPVQFLWELGNNLTWLARNIYNDSTVRELYLKRKEFHLIITDALLHDALYPFLHEMPFILVSTIGSNPQQSAAVGNIWHPAYIPTVIWDFPRPWGLLIKVFSFLSHITTPLVWSFMLRDPVQREISKQFPTLPMLYELEKNQSLCFLNTHPGLDLPLPLLPTQVPVGGIHITPAAPLPMDLRRWVEGVNVPGVLYVSLGSMTQGSTMPRYYRDIFVKVFRRLEHRVIWKFEEEVPDVSDNVMVRRWLPQQDILGHPRVQGFLSHGGLLSVQEAVYHATPLVAIPVCCDHSRGAARIHNGGLGRWLTWEHLTEEILLEVLQDILNNTRYKEEMDKASRRIQDEPQTAKEVAVFWTEYVVRHEGAHHLRSPASSLSWPEFFLLDVLVVLVAAFVVFVALVALVAHLFTVRVAKIKME